MDSLIAWLLSSALVPTGTLVWATGGLVTAVVLAVLLSTALLVLASQREPALRTVRTTGEVALPPHEDSRLPSAA